MSRSAYVRRKKVEVIARYGGACVCCGESQVEFLTLDHIDGSGNEDRRRMEPGKRSRPSGGVSFYNHLLRLEGRHPNIQLLCWNCNCTKHHYGKCPHERDLTSVIQGGILNLEDRNDPSSSRAEIGIQA